MRLWSQCRKGEDWGISKAHCPARLLACLAQVNERLCLKSQGRWDLRNNSQGCFLVSTYTCKYNNIHTYTHTCEHSSHSYTQVHIHPKIDDKRIKQLSILLNKDAKTQMPVAILIHHKKILTLRKMDSSADLRSIYLATKSWRSWSGCVLSQRT